MKTVRLKPQRREAVLHHDRDGYIRCRVCGCTEREPCDPPCSWAPGEADLCSNCEAAVLVVTCWLEGAHRPYWAALLREVEEEKRRWIVSGRSEFGHGLKVTFTKGASG
jgi:hypothetical protein